MKKIVPPMITVKQNESIEKMLKRFKKMVKKSKILQDYKLHTHYEKPSEKRKRKECLYKSKYKKG